MAVLPDSRLYAICRDDDFTFGVLSSRLHEVWALANASRHGDGDEGGRPTYNARDCFETFPFPVPDDAARKAVAEAAQRLDTARTNWLHPTEWVEWTPESVSHFPLRPVPKPCHEADLKKRTMTVLHNTRPRWLAQQHEALAAAVAVAYGWPDYTSDMPDAEILKRLLTLNLERKAAEGS